jgi:hypothetical protein
MKKHMIRNTTMTTALLTFLAMGAVAQQDQGHSHGDDADHGHGDDTHAHAAPSETETFFGSDAADTDAGQSGEPMHEHADEHAEGHGHGNAGE